MEVAKVMPVEPEDRRAVLLAVLLGVLILTALASASMACSPHSTSDRGISGGGTTLTSSTSASTSASVGRPPASTTATAEETETASASTQPGSSTAAGARVTITVLYDNAARHPGTRAGWGFSCLIEGLERTVLFDTGADGAILLANMEVLGIEPRGIDVVVLSHEHKDHVGGLAEVLTANPHVTVYYPRSFSEKTLRPALETGATLAPVDDPVSLCAGLTVTRPLGSPAESALLVDTAQGHLLVTGCAHPGITEITKSALDLVDEPIHAVLGGFHLMSHSIQEVDAIVRELGRLGVTRCGPAHCTGEAATTQIKAAFADGFMKMGVGAIIVF